MAWFGLVHQILCQPSTLFLASLVRSLDPLLTSTRRLQNSNAINFKWNNVYCIQRCAFTCAACDRRYGAQCVHTALPIGHSMHKTLNNHNKTSSFFHSRFESAVILLKPSSFTSVFCCFCCSFTLSQFMSEEWFFLSLFGFTVVK